MGKFDHQEAAFFAAAICFWTASSLAMKWFPALNIYYIQKPSAEVQIPLWRRRIPQFIELACWVSYVAYLVHFHWTVSDAEATLTWFTIFAIVALLALLSSRLFVWSFRRVRAMQARLR